MLAFFLWLRIEAPVEVDQWSVVPYERGRAPAGMGTVEQDILDRHAIDLGDGPSSRAGSRVD
jgi:hypothetical protein